MAKKEKILYERAKKIIETNLQFFNAIIDKLVKKPMVNAKLSYSEMNEIRETKNKNRSE